MTLRLKNEDILRLKIEIRADSDSEYQDIASLVDKPSFLYDIENIRKKLKLTRPLIYNLKIGNWFIIYYERYQKEHPKGYKFVESESTRLSKVYDRPLHRHVIIQAILFGKVSDLYPSLFHICSENIKFTVPTVALFPTQRTTDEEIREALKKAKEWYRSSAKISPYMFPPKYTSVSKEHLLIRAQREWYWMRLSGMKYKDIADKWHDLHPNFKPVPVEDRIIKDIKTYKQLLK